MPVAITSISSIGWFVGSGEARACQLSVLPVTSALATVAPSHSALTRPVPATLTATSATGSARPISQTVVSLASGASGLIWAASSAGGRSIGGRPSTACASAATTLGGVPGSVCGGTVAPPSLCHA